MNFQRKFNQVAYIIAIKTMLQRISDLQVQLYVTMVAEWVICHLKYTHVKVSIVLWHNQVSRIVENPTFVA